MENLIVKKTEDYSIFKAMDANRQVNLNHVNNLIRSMDTNGALVNPVIVNENYEIIDGQHRLRASLELGLPVYYLMVEGYGIKEVHALNLNQKNWSNQDYLEAYANDGNVNYQRLLEFQKRNENFGFYPIISFITGVSGFHLKDAHYDSDKNNPKRSKEGVKGIGFREGRMIISDLDIIRAQKLADKFLSLKSIFEHYNHSPFIGAMIVIMNNVKEFDFNKFKYKCQTYSDKLQKCSSRPGYYRMIHELYNYRQKRRINLFNPVNW